ncbi:MAG: hypothetical protein AB7D57_08520 [Desulfovibrionaceae bacterium]
MRIALSLLLLLLAVLGTAAGTTLACRAGRADLLDWLNFLATVGSLLAVFLALFFKEYFVCRLYGPRLKLAIDLEHGCYHQNCGHWNLRARVRNEGRTGAEQVEVFFEAVEYRAAEDQTWSPGGSVPSNLYWSFGGAYMPHLGIGMEKYVDVATTDPEFHDVSPEVVERYGKEWCGFRVCQQGVNKCRLAPGRYRLLLVVSAANCGAVRGRLDLTVAEDLSGDPGITRADWALLLPGAVPAAA